MVARERARGRDTACVLITPEPLSRSAGGLTLTLTARAMWKGDADRSRMMAGLTLAGNGDPAAAAD